ncbi:sigma-70 family RNA polymerase sigma factor [Candidatus Fermentibacteria bacterium]|nr:sigma-70 family RNA polymerase sigma factor [Candidatus Fermentibacteria bacterium]
MAKRTTYRDAEDRSLDLYLKEISTVSLLTQEQEVELAKRIKQGDEEALHQLTRANLRFVVSVAKQYKNQGLSLPDLINEGNVGLIKAAIRFDETKGYKFISYAVWWIRQAILQALAEHSRIVRLPLNRAGALHKIGKSSDQLGQEFGREPTPEEIADELSMSVDEVNETLRISGHHLSLDATLKGEDGNKLLDFLEDDLQPAPDEYLMDESLSTDIAKALETLTPREQEVTTLYFGINRDRPCTLEEIGQHLGLTRERVRQIKEKAIKRLRHAKRAKRLKAHLS